MERRNIKTPNPIKNMRIELWLVFIIIFALFLRLMFFIGLNWSDDVNYVYLANQILRGEYKPSYMASLRLMMIYPLALSFYLFGVSNFSAVLYPLVCSIGSIVLIFNLSKILFNEKVGLISAFLLSIFPLDVNYATWIMPDVPISFFIGLSVLFFFKGEASDRTTLLNVKKKYLFFILSGITVGLSYLLKLSGLVILIFYFIVWLYLSIKQRKIRFDFLLIILGFLIIVSLESIFYYVTVKDPLLQYHSGFEYYSEKERLKYEFNTNFDYYPKVMFNLDHLNRYMFNNPYTYFGPFFYIVILSIAYLLFKKDVNSIVVVLWLFSVFLYMQFGTMSIKYYIPMHRLDRHLTILTIPSILIISRFIYLDKKNKIKLLISFIVVLLLMVSFLYYIKNISHMQKAASEDMISLYEFLKQQPKKNVYCDYGCNGHLMFYFKFTRNEVFNYIGNLKCDDIKDSYVIVNATRGWIELENLKKDIPSCVKDPPKNWKIIKIIDNPTDVGPFNYYNPVVYYVE